MQYLSFCVWLISLSITVLKFTHAVANVRLSFFFLYCALTTFFILYIPLSCFHIFVIVNGAAINMGMQVLLWILIQFLSITAPTVGYLDHMVVLF